jgi:hypothetical protein
MTTAVQIAPTITSAKQVRFSKSIYKDEHKHRLAFEFLHLLQGIAAKDLVKGTEKTDPKKSGRPVSIQSVYNWRRQWKKGKRNCVFCPTAISMDRILQGQGYKLGFVQKDN